MLIVGIIIIANTTVIFFFGHKWADLINSISGLVLILFGINYFSKKKKNEKKIQYFKKLKIINPLT